LWARHTDMERFLMESGGAMIEEPDLAFEVHFAEWFPKRIAFLRRHVFWQIRLLTGLLSGQLFWRNLTVKDQYDRGRIRLPNELPKA
jgi:hypothetical protein